jgi:membrane protein
MPPAERVEPAEEPDLVPTPSTSTPVPGAPLADEDAGSTPSARPDMSLVGAGFLRPLGRVSRRDDVLGRVASLVADSFVVRCLVRLASISARDRVLVLAGQAFTTIIPLMILVSVLSPNDDALASRLVSRFGLTGSAADAVYTLFSRPPDSAGAFTAGSGILLFFSMLSYAKYLQRTYETAWGLPPAGWRGTLNGLAGVGLLLAQIVALAFLSGLLHRLPAGGLLDFVLRVGIAVGLWLQLQWLLLSRRVERRRLLPGALAAGAGQVVISIYSVAWMPRLIATNAERYGVIGVTFAILTWLIALSAAIVVTAVVSAEAGAAAAATIEGFEPEAANGSLPATPVMHSPIKDSPGTTTAAAAERQDAPVPRPPV